MKPTRLILLILMLLTALAVAMPPIDAEAGRFGGGTSTGARGSRSFSTPQEAAPRSGMHQSAPASPGMASPANPVATPPRTSGFASGLMGGIGGLLLGGMLGSMLFGGAGSGMGFLEIILLAGLGWFLYKRFFSKPSVPQTISMPAPATAQAGPTTGRVSLEKHPDLSSAQYQGSELPRTFAMGAPVDEVSQGLARIASMDPRFNEAYFINGAQGAFKSIQSAWSDWSVERLRPLLTDRMWQLIEQQAKERQAAGRRDIIEKIQFQTAEVSEAWQEAGEDWITVHFKVDLVEYETDVAGHVLNGNPNQSSTVEEYWTFCRPVGSSNPNWFLSAIQQPGEVARSVP
ncbi:MAG: Tim44 domain-containing protein [Magnetococcales bacterium]|nr:Tim44 domain-containing protein [Magnetococcales bacterium]